MHQVRCMSIPCASACRVGRRSGVHRPHTTSNIPAAPMPVTMHMVTMP